jgi:hypothetical protein
MYKKLIIALSFFVLISACQRAYYISPEQFARNLSYDNSLILTLENGQELSFDSITREHQGTVVIFWQSSCPCVSRYQERIVKLYEKYAPAGIAFLHVLSTKGESFEDAVKEYKKRTLPFPLLYDNNARLKNAVHAKGTPTAVLFDQDGSVRFMGWIDNERKVGESNREPYLENALKQYLAHEEISVNNSAMFGCGMD